MGAGAANRKRVSSLSPGLRPVWRMNWAEVINGGQLLSIALAGQSIILSCFSGQKPLTSNLTKLYQQSSSSSLHEHNGMAMANLRGIRVPPVGGTCQGCVPCPGPFLATPLPPSCLAPSGIPPRFVRGEHRNLPKGPLV